MHNHGSGASLMPLYAKERVVYVRKVSNTACRLSKHTEIGYRPEGAACTPEELQDGVPLWPWKGFLLPLYG